MLKKITPLVLLASFAAAAVMAEDVTLSDSQGVNLTIYNQNFGLVKDVRTLTLKEGVNSVRFEDVAAHIDPTTVSFQSLTAPNAVTVREQNYQYDLMDPNTILSKSIGKLVKFKQFLPSGATNEISGTLLNSPVATVSDVHGGSRTSHHGLVVRTNDGVVLNPSGEVHLAELPAGLISKPSLLWTLESTKGGQHKSEIAYQTSGMNWHADYVAIVNKDDNQVDLTSWVTLDNKSGGTYKNAALKLIAGDVHKVQPPMRGRAMMMDAVAESAPAKQFTEQSFAEYHLYTLQGKTDLNNNETKQLSLFSANQVPVRKLYVFDSENPQVHYGQPAKQKVNVKMEIANTEKNQLGMPMPKGKVRVYKRDSDGALQFIGEDEIDHTPHDEKLKIYIGDAFDVVAERRQVSMRQESDRVQRYTYEVEFRNHKKEKVTVTAVEHSWGDWKILNSTHQYDKKDSRTFEFTVDVPANGKTVINYEIQIRQ